MNKPRGTQVPFIEFLYSEGGPDALSRFPGGVLIAKALLLYPVLELVAEDATIQNCLNLIVLLVI